MTTTTRPDTAIELVSQLSGDSLTPENVCMMIGIGTDKDSPAVFFQYLGEKNYKALMLPNGKPLTSLINVRLQGLSVADGVGEFESTKLNLFLATTEGNVVMLTSGLNTYWSQCVLTGLMALADEDLLNETIKLDTWKGTSKMQPCFAAIHVNGKKYSEKSLYEQLAELRSMKGKDERNAAMAACLRQAVDIISTSYQGIEPVTVEEAPKQITPGVVVTTEANVY